MQISAIRCFTCNSLAHHTTSLVATPKNILIIGRYQTNPHSAGESPPGINEVAFHVCSCHTDPFHIPDRPGRLHARERFIRLPEVLYTTGLSRSTVYEMMTRKQFPAQVSLGGKTVAWLESEVESWMAERIANRHQGAAA